ncbi:MAG TPA: glycoside hydrolase N-terminal domain-containing protein, partial [Polyangiaceae bacterium]|nr:glycoside hydrolase N-terminal domain-containing protein [Polyangiaceae bacterium]
VVAVRLGSDKRASITFDVTLTTPQDARQELDGDATLVVRGKNREDSHVAGALSFEARVHVVAPGGSLSARDGTISVTNADSALLLIAVATSYKTFRDTSGDPRAATARQIAAAREKSYERLLADHVAEHQRLFHKVSIDLGVTDAAARPTDERVRRSAHVDDPQLAALYFQFGRYLLMGSSRPGGQPANLQGLWNDSLSPPWGSKYTININTEMNYWAAEPTGLAECVEPLIAMVKDLAETGARTAMVHYGARGWVAHHNTDLWRASAPIDGATWGMWPTGGAWLCNVLWDHYDYGRDDVYLADIYPVLRGAAEFFLDTLVEEPKHKWLVTCPSVSPENVHPGGTSICAGPTMDEQLVRDLFAHCVEASEILGVDAPLRQRLREASARLAPNQVGSAGQLQEWLEDWDMQAPEMHHRHVSHLYGVFPSSQITVEHTPALAAAARRSLEIRGDEATGWGIAWRLNLWARLGDAERAHKILRCLLGPERTYPNLFDSCPPFQIDGNFGGVSGITEMLVQSHSGVIRLLPSLPKAWPAGSVRGLRARGGFGVDVAWKLGRLESATLRGPRGARSVIRYEQRDLAVSIPESGRARVTLDGDRLRSE